MTVDRVAREPSLHERNAGFTLLELMFTLIVAGLLLGIAVPGFFDTIRSNRAAANANEFVTALSIGRSEAVRRSARVTLCPTRDGAGCNGTWTDRWVLFVDGATSDTGAPSFNAANVLREWTAPSGDAVITTNPAGVTWVRFLPRGEARANAAMPVVFNMEINGCSGLEGRNVELNAVGRTRVERVAC